MWLAALIPLVLSQSWATGATATLTVAEIVAPPGASSVSLPISISVPPGQRVAALQFDIEFDASALEIPATAGIVPSATLKAAGKQVNYSTLSPGKVRVLIIGFNQEVIPDCEVVSVLFTIRRGGMHALEPVGIRNALLSDPGGSKVPEEGRNGGVRFAASPVAPLPSGRKSDSVVLSLAVACGVLVVGAAGGVVWTRRARRKPRPRSKT